MANVSQAVNFVNSLATIDFYGQTLLATIQDNVVYTALKPICENIGLSWNAQFERIKRDEVLAEGIRMIRTPTKGGFQDVVCLPLTLLNGWLFGVDVSRVKSEIKDKLITYKKECYQALFDYWHKGTAVNPRRITISVEQRHTIQKAIKAKCQHNSTHYQTVYHALYDHFKVESYKELLASDFDEAMAFITDFNLADDVSEYNALWKLIGLLEYERIDKEIRELKHTIDTAYRQIERISRTKGLIYDAISEQKTNCPYNTNRLNEAKAFIAKQMVLKKNSLV